MSRTLTGYLIIFALLFVAAGVAISMASTRFDRIENRQAYVFEIIRRRQLSPEICEGFSDGWMTCAMNAKKQCECNFEPDDLDIANQIYADAVKAAAAQIVAEKQDEDEAPAAD
jgi:hypothetical protein